MWQVGTKLGRFRLDREIGQGSHGVVFMATDTALDAQVAVKILHPWLTQDTAVRDRFKRELLLARRVAHPGVCRLFDLHEEGSAFFITMDYVEGQTLLGILKTEGRIMPARGVKILRGVCQALAAAHAAGVIHRDLKPANVIVRAGDVPMILDFGTATAQDVSRVTRPGTAVGSMRFIAPEVFTGTSPSIRTDLYSLGVVAYVTLAGKLPYNAVNGAMEMLDVIRTQPPVRIDAMQPDVPARLADVVARAMEKDPEARFATASAFDEALADAENYLEPTHATPRVISGDFAAWAPAGMIKDSVTGAQLAVNRVTSAEAAALAATAAAAANTVVNGRAQPTLGSSPGPSATGEGLPVVEGAPDLSPSEEGAPTEPMVRPLEPTVRVAQFDLLPPQEPSSRRGIAKLVATVKGADRRLLAAAGVGALGVLVIVGALLSSGGDEDETTLADDAGAVAAGGNADGGTLALADDAGKNGSDPVDGGDGALKFAFEDTAEDENDDEDAGPGAAVVKKKKDPKDPRTAEGIKQVRKAMVKKGFAPGDLPAVEQSLKKALAAGAKGKRDEADRLIFAARAVVEKQPIDRAFIATKMSRFNKAYDRSRRPDIADKVEPLAREAASSWAGGQYEQANQKLNRAFALVAKKK